MDLIGKTLAGKYRIIKEIGRGGMAVVYEGLHLVLDKKVAIKVLHGRLGVDEAFRQRLIREAKAAAKLDHPNIVQIYDAEMSDECDYIVMEDVEGKDLKTIIEQEGALSVGRILNIAIQIADALRCAHEHGIVHRDIKPQNILIGKDDKVKVTDFGIARATGSSTITLTGTTIGTPEYMSPEQAEGERELDKRSDIYSLGIVMYEMVSGKVPFHAKTPMATLIKHIQEKPQAIKEVMPNTPEPLGQIIHACLNKKAENRYQDTVALIKDLELVRQGKEPQIVPAVAEEEETTTTAAVVSKERMDATAVLKITGQAITQAMKPVRQVMAGQSREVLGWIFLGLYILLMLGLTGSGIFRPHTSELMCRGFPFSGWLLNGWILMFVFLGVQALYLLAPTVLFPIIISSYFMGALSFGTAHLIYEGIRCWPDFITIYLPWFGWSALLFIRYKDENRAKVLKDLTLLPLAASLLLWAGLKVIPCAHVAAKYYSKLIFLWSLGAAIVIYPFSGWLEKASKKDVPLKEIPLKKIIIIALAAAALFTILLFSVRFFVNLWQSRHPPAAEVFEEESVSSDKYIEEMPSPPEEPPVAETPQYEEPQYEEPRYEEPVAETPPPAQEEVAAESVYWIYSYSEALTRASFEGKLVMMDFYAKWCGWCKKMDTETYRDSRVITASRDFICLKIDADKYPEIAAGYGVTGYPTILFVDSDERIISGRPGYRDADTLLAEMNQALSR